MAKALKDRIAVVTEAAEDLGIKGTNGQLPEEALVHELRRYVEQDLIESELPVDSYREAAPFLRRPFTADAAQFKVQATFPKGDPQKAMVVAYIDARLVVERLNMICPHLWHDAYTPLDGGRLLCSLTIDGITRHDVGADYVGKGLYSDALKRAGVKFGVGVSLYAVPRMWLTLESGGTLRKSGSGQKQTLWLTDRGEQEVRSLYASWLEEHGIKAFGQPLDHGDVAGAVGDPEATPAPDNGEGSDPPQRAAESAREAPQQEAPADAHGKAEPDDEQGEAQALAELLDEYPKDSPMGKARHAANDAMRSLGAKADQRVRELRGAQTGRALEQLVKRVEQAKAAQGGGD
jgi:hypothetical protein